MKKKEIGLGASVPRCPLPSAVVDPGFLRVWDENLLFGKTCQKLRENERNWTERERFLYTLMLTPPPRQIQDFPGRGQSEREDKIHHYHHYCKTFRKLHGNVENWNGGGGGGRGAACVKKFTRCIGRCTKMVWFVGAPGQLFQIHHHFLHWI